MTRIHDSLRKLTIRQLSVGPKGQGTAAVLTRTVKGEYDPSTGDYGITTVTNYNGSGLRVNFTNFEYKDTTIQHGDFKLYFCPVLQDGTDSPVPVIADIITFVGTKYKVVNMETWNSGGVDCGWKLQMRKG